VLGDGVMLTRMKLGNFKSWRELDIELAPLTLLFGTNSSGKTAILQAPLLLKQTANSFDRGQHINFGGSDRDYVDFGSYQDLVYGHDEHLPVEVGLEWTTRFSELARDTDWKKRSLALKWYFDGQNVIESSRQMLEIRHGDQWQRYVDVERKNDWESFSIDLFFDFYSLGPIRQPPKDRFFLWTGSTPTVIEPDGENTIAALIASERNNGTTPGLLTQVREWLAYIGVVNDFSVASIDADNRIYETQVRTVANSPFSSLLDVGFGVSQVLPVITMLFFVRPGSIVLIEQPELHLHPKAQAELADLFLHVAETRKLQLIIESHSEHLLRRLQRRVAETEYPFANPDNIRAYFCRMTEAGSVADAVVVDKYGQIRNWPDNFFGDIGGDLDALTDAALERRRQELLSGG
jgi:predicted ATPase